MGWAGLGFALGDATRSLPRGSDRPETAGELRNTNDVTDSLPPPPLSLLRPVGPATIARRPRSPSPVLLLVLDEGVTARIPYSEDDGRGASPSPIPFPLPPSVGNCLHEFRIPTAPRQSLKRPVPSLPLPRRRQTGDELLKCNAFRTPAPSLIEPSSESSLDGNLNSRSQHPFPPLLMRGSAGWEEWRGGTWIEDRNPVSPVLSPQGYSHVFVLNMCTWEWYAHDHARTCAQHEIPWGSGGGCIRLREKYSVSLDAGKKYEIPYHHPSPKKSLFACVVLSAFFGANTPHSPFRHARITGRGGPSSEPVRPAGGQVAGRRLCPAIARNEQSGVILEFSCGRGVRGVIISSSSTLLRHAVLAPDEIPSLAAACNLAHRVAASFG